MKFKITKKEDGRWELRVSDGTGKDRVQFRRLFPTEAAAKRFKDGEVYKLRVEKAEEKKAGGDVMALTTFSQLREEWRRSKRYEKFAPGHKRNCDQYWESVRYRLDGVRVAAITPSLMNALEVELENSGRRTSSVSTIKRKITFIKAILNYAVEMQRIPFNPVASYRPVKPIKVEMKYWRRDEALSFLEFAQRKYPVESRDHWKFLVYSVALHTGMRASEIWALRPSDLSHATKEIVVSRQFDLVDRVFRETKGKKTRLVPLPRELGDRLQAWIDGQGLKSDSLVFSSGESPIDHNNFNKRVFAVDLSEWGGNRIRFHDLRHSAATMMLVAGTPLPDLQKALGHEKVETTMTYLHAMDDGVRKIAERHSLLSSVPVKSPPPSSGGRHLRIV